MIKVSFIKNDDTKYLTMDIKGHAGQADIGKDIICASASILAYTVAQIVTTMKEEGRLMRRPTIKLKAGNCTISCSAKTDEDYAELMHTFFVAQVGCSLLAHNYPQFVSVKLFGKTE